MKALSHDFLLAAPEKQNSIAYAFDLDKGLKSEPIQILEGVGGTMSLVQIPETLDFLATREFYPPFAAENSEIVLSKWRGDHWDVSHLLKFPYLHRFDLVKVNNRILFIGATITEHKDSLEDWSTPGHLYVGEWKEEKINNLKRLPMELHLNHGFRPMLSSGYHLITAREGVFKLIYPDESSSQDWKLEKVYDDPISDIYPIDIHSYDLKDDSKQSYLAIEGFHGKKLALLNNSFQKILAFKGDFPFAHALWAGSLNGHETAIFGYRSGEKQLYKLDFTNGLDNISFSIVDEHVGSTNLLKFDKDGVEYLVSANREISELAVYKNRIEE